MLNVTGGGKEILISVLNGAGAIRSVRLNRKPYSQHDKSGIGLPHAVLEAKNLVEIEMQA
jgi:hypothetical protein